MAQLMTPPELHQMLMRQVAPTTMWMEMTGVDGVPRLKLTRISGYDPQALSTDRGQLCYTDHNCLICGWRVWDEKPTQDEMKDAPWGGEEIVRVLV